MMWREFKHFVDQHNILAQGDKVLLAMSGGVDSMVLGHLLKKTEVDFEVAHCNYKLRGEASDSDEAFVRQWCDEHSIVCHVEKIHLKSAGSNRSIQEEARNARYTWFKELMNQRELNKLATAHHASDNAETLFINILRGAGAKGWSGITVSSDTIIRPLLFATKNQIFEFAEQEQIDFREDESNASVKYLRNRIRHQIVPAFKELKPGFEARISENQLHLQQMMHLIDELILRENHGVITGSDQEITVHYTKIKPSAFTKTILFHWLQPFGFNSGQVSNILNSQTGAEFFSRSHKLLVDREKLILKPIQSLAGSTPIEIFRGQTKINAPVGLEIIEVHASETEVSRSADTAHLDLSALEFPLILRRWKHGDRFRPLGMKNSKLISDFLTDIKISRYEKEEQLVVVSGGQIVWVVGRRIADSAKATDATDIILQLKIQK